MIYWARSVQPSLAEAICEPPVRGPGEWEAAVITTKNILWVLVLGSVWGVAELFGKDLLTDFGVGGASIWLAAWAILLLSIGRGVWNKIGSSAIIGLIAAAFKFAGPSTNYCHLLGIASPRRVFRPLRLQLAGPGEVTVVAPRPRRTDHGL